MVGRLLRRICWLHPFAWHPHAPGLSHSCGFAPPLQLASVLILFLLHPLRRSKCSPDRELCFSGFKHFMTGAGTWLKPDAWGCKTKERIDPKRRGFRPTVTFTAAPTPSCPAHSVPRQ